MMYKSSAYTPQIKEVLLEQIKLGVAKRISPSVARSLQLGTMTPYDLVERLTDEFVVELRGFIWGEDLGEIIEKYLEDWKEAFKERWFPTWLLKKYPVRYKIFRARQKVAYPNFDMPSLGDEKQIYYLQRS